ncbi:MAG: hypothetical protein BJ554DRAFT_4888 [Olpidium bornovanus]|uniref:Uncharacterized protein n=1 Tax=Olpidium bornovanus TaxID=278681 RepID=A0A8H7ZM68_9FUNG|nr:MAG: hypothetical protein BJ554DRAFT_4888 [Olpidium bornovanus]
MILEKPGLKVDGMCHSNIMRPKRVRNAHKNRLFTRSVAAEDRPPLAFEVSGGRRRRDA